jgi:hypothetical protein
VGKGREAETKKENEDSSPINLHQQLADYETRIMVEIAHLREAVDLLNSTFVTSDTEEELRKSVVSFGLASADTYAFLFMQLQKQKANSDIAHLQRGKCSYYVSLLLLLFSHLSSSKCMVSSLDCLQKTFKMGGSKVSLVRKWDLLLRV